MTNKMMASPGKFRVMHKKKKLMAQVPWSHLKMK